MDKVTRKDFDALQKDFEELKKIVHTKTYLPEAVIAPPPLDVEASVVECKATEEVEQYQVVIVTHQATEGLIPAASVYDRSDAADSLCVIGICLDHALTDEQVRVQVSGIQFVSIEANGGTYGSASDRIIRVGCELRCKDGGYAEVLDHDDLEGAMFMSLRDCSNTDKFCLVKILDQKEEYRGPFKGIIDPSTTTPTTIKVGYDRAFTATATRWEYGPIADRINWVNTDGTFTVKTLTAVDSVAIAADNTYVYYEISNPSGTITATLKASTVWPPSVDPSSATVRIHLIGIARYDSGDAKITGWTQVHQGEIYLYAPGYDGPFKATKTGSAQVTVGAERSATPANYDHTDTLQIMQGDGTIAATTAKTASEAVTATDTGYAYYEADRDSGDTWVLSALKYTETWPLPSTSTTKDAVLIPVAYVVMTAGVIVTISQMLRGNPIIWERPVAENGQVLQQNENMLVAGMTVSLWDTTPVAIPAASFPLNVNKEIYVTAYLTLSTGAWTITGTYESVAGATTFHSFSSGVRTYQWLVAEISSGKMYQRRKGNIEVEYGTLPQYSIEYDGTTGKLQLVGDESAPGNNKVYGTDGVGAKGWNDFTAGDEKVAAASGDTAGYLDAVITDGDDNNYDGNTDVGVSGDTTVNANEITLYAEMDEIMGWSAADAVGVFIHELGIIKWVPGIELSEALKLISGHGNSKTLKTTGAGEPEWTTV